MDKAVRIAMWSGPRNISTAMMRSFASRADAVVVDEPFYAAYLAATGLDERRSDPSGVFVFRKGSPDIVYTFDLKNPGVMPLVQRFPMKGEDIVYVTEAPLARWNRMISQILPTTVTQAANVGARYAR